MNADYKTSMNMINKKTGKEILHIVLLFSFYSITSNAQSSPIFRLIGGEVLSSGLSTAVDIDNTRLIDTVIVPYPKHGFMEYSCYNEQGQLSYQYHILDANKKTIFEKYITKTANRQTTIILKENYGKLDTAEIRNELYQNNRLIERQIVFLRYHHKDYDSTKPIVKKRREKSYRNTYENDPYDNIIHKVKLTDQSDTLKQVHFTYNQQQKQIKKIEYSDDHSIETRYFYNDAQHLIKEISVEDSAKVVRSFINEKHRTSDCFINDCLYLSIEKNNNELTTAIFKYRHNMPIKVMEGEYEYDKFGNWISGRIRRDDEGLTSSTEWKYFDRKIIYKY